MQPSTLHSITVLDLSCHESGGNSLIWKANVITVKKEGKCSVCWHHSSIYLPSSRALHTGMCLCSRCFLWELSHAALGDPAVSVPHRQCIPGFCICPPKASLTKHCLNCLSLPPQHAKNLLGFCQDYLTKSSLRKVARGRVGGIERS